MRDGYRANGIFNITAHAIPALLSRLKSHLVDVGFDFLLHYDIDICTECFNKLSVLMIRYYLMLGNVCRLKSCYRSHTDTATQVLFH